MNERQTRLAAATEAIERAYDEFSEMEPMATEYAPLPCIPAEDFARAALNAADKAVPVVSAAELNEALAEANATGQWSGAITLIRKLVVWQEERYKHATRSTT